MDVGSITAGYTGLKFIKDSLEVMLGYKVDIESQNRINAALKEVGTIPTVSLGVTYAVVCIYGCDDGTIEPTRCVFIDAVLDGR